MFPKPHVRDRRMLRFTEAGPRPALRWMVAVPGAGLRLKQPNPGAYFNDAPGHPEAGKSTSAGRCTALPSPDGSGRPVVMLYGAPLLTLKKGVAVIFQGRGIPVPSTAR